MDEDNKIYTVEINQKDIKNMLNGRQPTKIVDCGDHLVYVSFFYIRDKKEGE